MKILKIANKPIRKMWTTKLKINLRNLLELHKFNGKEKALEKFVKYYKGFGNSVRHNEKSEKFFNIFLIISCPSLHFFKTFNLKEFIITKPKNVT